MKITQELVERIAHLARLKLSEEERENMTAQLEDILGSMTALDALTLEEEEQEQELCDILRPDEERTGTDREQLLGNAADTDGEYILVPGGTNGEGGDE